LEWHVVALQLFLKSSSLNPTTNSRHRAALYSAEAVFQASSADLWELVEEKSSNLSRQTVMSKFANVVTIEVAPGRRDQVVTLLLAHKARLKDEPGTLQFEVLLPKDDDTKVLVYEMYRDAAAFEVHLNGPSLAQWKEETAGMVVKLHGVRSAVVDESVH
jgi:(4S)-4-hydroxy-5-phosphonooxypentane-2,3-dione isomerase